MGVDSEPWSIEPSEILLHSNETISFNRSNPLIATIETTLICVYKASSGASLRNVVMFSLLNAYKKLQIIIQALIKFIFLGNLLSPFSSLLPFPITLDDGTLVSLVN